MSTVLEGALFGAGGDEPWAAALDGDAEGLALVPEDGRLPAQPLDLARWTATADAVDRRALAGLAGPLLDVGCGPGRMIRAAVDTGLTACGVDASRAAARHCARLGLPVLHRSVFDPVPRTGAWGSVLLLDGNVGIGGDVPALLSRCRELLAPGGLLVVEAHPDPDRDEVVTVRLTGGGGTSARFRWAHAGSDAVLRAAAGFDGAGAFTADGRAFLRLRRR